MKAVDFVCRLLLNMEQIALTHTELKVLVAVTAGECFAEDVSYRMDMRDCTVTYTLRSLRRKGLLVCNGCEEMYQLTSEGKQIIYRLFNQEITDHAQKKAFDD